MSQDELIAAAKAAAARRGIDPALVCAVCEQESGWNPWAIRYEPAFYARYIEPMVLAGRITNATEAQARAFSWGLMQVMGEVAREHGYAGHMAALCDPATGLEIGCLHLASKLVGASGDVRRALLAWNGGADGAYPDEVLARMGKYQTT